MTTSTDGRERAIAAWQRLVEARAAGTIVHGRVLTTVKGGALVQIDGYRGFLPASQTTAKTPEELAALKGTTLPLKVLDVDETRKRLVVSHKRAADEQRRAERRAFIAELQPGDEREATVVRLVEFGAFVDLGHGVDALVPLSELAHERIAKPDDAVQVGERIRVRILRVEQNGKRIAASRKALLHDPWREHAQLLRRGAAVTATVVSTERRLEVELAPGIRAVVPEREADPAEYAIGEQVEVTIRSVDHRLRRVRVSTLPAGDADAPTSFAPLGVELGRALADALSPEVTPAP
jgi:small subunit ribosomal protein S1